MQRPGITFDHNKCVVIHEITDITTVPTDDKLKRIIGKIKREAIIDRVMRYGVHKQKIMVQFATQDMATAINSGWDVKAMGGSKCRLPQHPSQTVGLVGIAKGVPLDLDDTELQQDIEENFARAVAQRFVSGKDNSKLRTVKISFRDQVQLNRATQSGILLSSISVCVRVEKAAARVRVVQCYKCWRFGHIAANCSRSKVCPACGNGDLEGHACLGPDQCTNCGGTHNARNLPECPAHVDRLQILTLRADKGSMNAQ